MLPSGSDMAKNNLLPEVLVRSICKGHLLRPEQQLWFWRALCCADPEKIYGMTKYFTVRIMRDVEDYFI